MACQNCVNQGLNRKENQVNGGQIINVSSLVGSYSQCPQCNNVVGANGANLLINHIQSQNDALNGRENSKQGCLCFQRMQNYSLEARRIPTLSSNNNRIENIRGNNVYCCCCCGFGVANSCVSGMNYTCNNACFAHSCCICSNNTLSGSGNFGAFGTSGLNGASFVVNDNSGNIKQVNEVNQCLTGNNASVSGGTANSNSEICSPNVISGAHVVTHNGNQHDLNYKTINPDMINIALTGQTPESLTISVDSRGVVTLGVNNIPTNTNGKTSSGGNFNVSSDDSRARIRNALTDRSQN
ncbi:hypothetical protein FG386_000660 [Cryptosporidium ryanae]|uniref:uncharacterized protein n=1 Tax=Cryptosporidium ryanae TaxID=515981 RepID=UPI00351A395B|nr:hypothetical protein FG386_000660 [Cryptosporidium ryanae]